MALKEKKNTSIWFTGLSRQLGCHESPFISYFSGIHLTIANHMRKFSIEYGRLSCGPRGVVNRAHAGPGESRPQPGSVLDALGGIVLTWSLSCGPALRVLLVCSYPCHVNSDQRAPARSYSVHCHLHTVISNGFAGRECSVMSCVQGCSCPLQR